MQPDEIREKLVEALRLDLVGPEKDSDLENEILSQDPSRWYLTGFLVPLEAGEEQRRDEDANDEIDEHEERGATDDAQIPEPPSAKRAFFPSSMGLSFLVTAETKNLSVTARWGDYEPIREDKEQDRAPEDVQKDEPPRKWQRIQKEERVDIAIPESTERPIEQNVPNSNGLQFVLTVQKVTNTQNIPPGTRSLSLFLVNKRPPSINETRDIAFIFQAQLENIL